MEEWWDTTALCEAFNVDGACCMLVDNTPIHTNLTGKYFGGGMHGLKHSEETKRKMSETAKGRDMSHLLKFNQKPIKLIDSDNNIHSFNSNKEAYTTLGLDRGQLSRLVASKIKTYRGYRLWEHQ